MELATTFSALQWLQGGAVAALIYWVWFCYRRPSLTKALCKGAVVTPFIVAVWIFDGPVLLYLALGFCLLGDIMLVFDDDRQFLAGVAAFALGHVAYIALFLTHPLAEPAVIGQTPFVFVVMVLLAAAAIVAPILFRGAGALRFAVLGYVPMIGGMGIAGLGFALQMPIVTIGALLFVVSDLVLGLEMFVLKSSTWAARLAPFWVWATYWSAQVLLVLGLA